MKKLNKKLKATNAIVFFIIVISILLGIFIGIQINEYKGIHKIKDIKESRCLNAL